MRVERPLTLAALQHQGWQMNGTFGPKAAVHLGPARCSAAFLKRTLAMERSI
jgi:hypothetical protein